MTDRKAFLVKDTIFPIFNQLNIESTKSDMEADNVLTQPWKPQL